MSARRIYIKTTKFQVKMSSTRVLTLFNIKRPTVCTRQVILFQDSMRIFFMLSGVIGQITFRPSIWYRSPQPLVLVFIGLPLIAIACVLNVLHKRRRTVNRSIHRDEVSDLDVLERVYCRYCGAEIPSDSMFCEGCGKQLGISQ